MIKKIKRKAWHMIFRKKEGAVIENMLVALIGIVMMMAFLVIIFGAFSSISHKWEMRQTAREFMLRMETEGYLDDAAKDELIKELEESGLKNVDLSGTTINPVGYGDKIYLCISGTYDENILAFAKGISKVTTHPVQVEIKMQTTAKQ